MRGILVQGMHRDDCITVRRLAMCGLPWEPRPEHVYTVNKWYTKVLRALLEEGYVHVTVAVAL